MQVYGDLYVALMHFAYCLCLGDMNQDQGLEVQVAMGFAAGITTDLLKGERLAAACTLFGLLVLSKFHSL